ncbi:MAG: carbohydrate ABC transporter permease [Chloroflexi bacterium]|nr:carbohydrate ABC transporter permease [Chloroflexota bacterium]
MTQLVSHLSRRSIPDGIAFALGLITALLFTILPWASVVNTTYRGTELLTRGDGILQIDRSLLLAVPIAIIIVLGNGLWGMFDDKARRVTPFGTLAAGVLGLSYYASVFADLENTTLDLAASGFWLSLGMMLLMILQVFIPRQTKLEDMGYKFDVFTWATMRADALGRSTGPLLRHWLRPLPIAGGGIFLVLVLFVLEFLGTDAAAAFVLVAALIVSTYDVPDWLKQSLNALMYVAMIVLIATVLSPQVAIGAVALSIVAALASLNILHEVPDGDNIRYELYGLAIALIYLIMGMLVGVQLGVALASLLSLLYILSLKLPARQAGIFYGLLGLAALWLALEILGPELTAGIFATGAFLLLYSPVLDRWLGLVIFAGVCIAAVYFGLTFIGDQIGSRAIGGVVGLVICLILIQPAVGHKRETLEERRGPLARVRLPALYINLLYPLYIALDAAILVWAKPIGEQIIDITKLLIGDEPIDEQIASFLDSIRLGFIGRLLSGLDLGALSDLIEEQIVVGVIAALLVLMWMQVRATRKERAGLVATARQTDWHINIIYIAVCTGIMLLAYTVISEEIGNRAFGMSLGVITCTIVLQIVPATNEESWERGLISKLEMQTWYGRMVYRVLMITLLLLAVTVLFPFAFTLTAGLKTTREIYRSGLVLWPDNPLWNVYQIAWDRFDIVQLMQNTFVLVIGSVLMQIGISVLAAYSLSRLKPAGGSVIMLGFLITLMIPSIAYLVPLYVTARDLSLLGSYWGIWLPAGVNAFMIFVLKSFFDNLPSELFDAAKVDGAGPLHILWYIVLPLSRPIILVFAILTFVNFWKDFLWPYLILLLTPEKQPVAVYLYRITETQANIPMNQQMAAYFMAMIPPLLIAIFLQRYMRQGLSIGAVKG